MRKNLNATYSLPIFIRDALTEIAKANNETYTATLIDCVNRFVKNNGLNQQAMNQRQPRRTQQKQKARLLIEDRLATHNRHIPEDAFAIRLSHFVLPEATINSIVDIARSMGITNTGAVSLAVLEAWLWDLKKSA